MLYVLYFSGSPPSEEQGMSLHAMRDQEWNVAPCVLARAINSGRELAQHVAVERYRVAGDRDAVEDRVQQ